MAELHVKGLSKWSYVIALVWIMVMSVLKAFAPVFFKLQIDISVQEILFVGFGCIAVCSPIIVNLIIDKFVATKKEP